MVWGATARPTPGTLSESREDSREQMGPTAKTAVVDRNKRRWLITLTTLALLTVALRATVFTDAAFSFRSVNSSNQVTAASLAFTNDKDGAIIVNAAGLRPGKSQAGTATLTIAGTAAGRYTLSRTSLTDLPSGTQLSATLTLLVEDITGTATTLYSGTVAAFSSISLGSLSPGAQKVYRFTVSFPLAGANPVLQGASTSLALRFLAVSP